MNELMTSEQTPLRALDVRAQVNLIQEVMRDVMQGPTKENPQGVHYGIVPGCGDKPTLLQPGAHKLLMTFRLVPDPEMTMVDMGNGHREVRCKVKLYSQSGVFLGAGVGTCSTMEGKYRFRTGPVEFTEKPVPKEYWDLRKTDPVKAKELLGDGMVAKKNDAGVWVCAMQGSKVEHDNPADYYNTVEKMAYKRALVSATLTVTAASDIFTQDIEDMPEVIPQPTPAQQEKQEARQANDKKVKAMQNSEGVASVSSRTDPAMPAEQAGTLTPPIQDVTISSWRDIMTAISDDPDLAELRTIVQKQLGLANLMYPKMTAHDRIEFLQQFKQGAEANGLLPRVKALGL